MNMTMGSQFIFQPEKSSVNNEDMNSMFNHEYSQENQLYVPEINQVNKRSTTPFLMIEGTKNHKPREIPPL